MTESITVSRLKEAMANASVDQAQLATLAGCTQGAISQILLGKTQRSRYLPDIAAALGVSVNWLRGDGDSVGVALPREKRTGDDVVTLRRFDLSYSMGPGTNIDDYVEESPFEFDRSLLQRLTRTTSDRCYIATGHGDSNFPTILDHDDLLIDTSQRTLNQRDRFWAISLHGAGAVKRLRAVGPDRILIMSDNKAVAPDEEVAAEDVYLIGRVIWLGRRM